MSKYPIEGGEGKSGRERGGGKCTEGGERGRERKRRVG